MPKALSNQTLSLANLLVLDSGKSYGSGFQIFTNNFSFLVTARHVLYSEDDIKFSHLRILCPNDKDLSLPQKALEVDLQLAKIFKSDVHDIAVILLAELKHLDSIDIPNDLVYYEYVSYDTGNNINVIADFNFVRLFNEIKISNYVYLSGYPISLGLYPKNAYFDDTKPLLRKGIIAGKNYDQETFIIDCASYYGNSGGPVNEVGENDEIRIIGLVSRYIPLEIKWRHTREELYNSDLVNSGYTVCVPMDAVYKLFEKIIPILD